MSDPVYFYGVDGTRGGYLVPPIEPEPEPDAAPEPLPCDARRPGRRMRSFDPNDPRFARKPQRPRRFRGWVDGVKPDELSSAGWAAIFPHDIDAAVVRALAPLLELRREQATAKDTRRYKLCRDGNGYLPDDTATAFLARHRAGLGPADPEIFPYYVLLVGHPHQIPFAFQYELDSQYAVGRVCFDTPAEYAAYARAVVAAEARTRQDQHVDVAFFATEHLGDKATETSARQLALPLLERLRTSGLPCNLSMYRGSEATKATALSLLGGHLKPALLFSATHGLAFERGDERHLAHQGALLCQNPDRPMLGGPGSGISPEDYLGAHDIGLDADVAGLIAFLFGCYTAGTPAAGGPLGGHLREPLLAREEFVARLPQRLLAHPRGGALAVIGHVDPAWSLSFWSPQTGPQTGTFRTVLQQLVRGFRIGHALEAFGQRLGQAGVVLNGDRDRKSDAQHLATAMATYEDARNYVLLGDPAVRLPPPPPPPRRRRLRGWDPNAPA